MKIYNEMGVEITRDDVDNDLGHLSTERRVKEHHEATSYIPREIHYEPKTFYFDDGSSYECVDGINDPHVKVVDKIQGIFQYKNDDGDIAPFKGLDIDEVVDQEEVQEKEAYDDYEDVYIYKLYTEEEIAEHKAYEEKIERQQTFLENGPDQLDINTSSIEDLTLMLSDVIGGALE